jgi:protoheme ferro-lyase
VSPSNGGGKGWNSLSSGDKNTVIVACVSIIAIGGVIAGAVFVIKKHQTQQAYTAAMLAKDLDHNDNDGDDDRLLMLAPGGPSAINGGGDNYEDEFEETAWKPETYGDDK